MNGFESAHPNHPPDDPLPFVIGNEAGVTWDMAGRAGQHNSHGSTVPLMGLVDSLARIHSKDAVQIRIYVLRRQMSPWDIDMEEHILKHINHAYFRDGGLNYAMAGGSTVKKTRIESDTYQDLVKKAATVNSPFLDNASQVEKLTKERYKELKDAVTMKYAREATKKVVAENAQHTRDRPRLEKAFRESEKKLDAAMGTYAKKLDTLLDAVDQAEKDVAWLKKLLDILRRQDARDTIAAKARQALAPQAGGPTPAPSSSQ